MALYMAFLKAVGKAALNAVGAGIAGEVACEVLPEVARKVRDWWAKDRTPEQRQAEVQALANASPEEARKAVDQVVAEVGRGQPAQVKKALSLYLSLVPGAARASLRKACDDLPLDADEDLVPLLPAHLPRFKPGDRPLAGIDWELEELLGAGGFGEVWKARNPHFDAVAPVALKFCLDPSAKDRLLRHEAAVLNQVMRQGRHPGIVQLKQTYLSAEPPCLEYEFVSGGDLAGLIQRWRTRRPGTERIASLMRDLASTVAFAHRLSPPIVHRDLKPANILIEQSGDAVTLRIADFGISGLAASRAVKDATRGVSQGAFLVTALRGAHTPLYASPQQMRGAAPDPRDDVYALGVIWHQLLTGDLLAGRPGGTRWTGKLAALGVPADQIELLSSCLEDDPADRPVDAGEMADRLGAKPVPAKVALLAKPAARPAAPKATPLLVPKRDLPKTLTNSIGMRFLLVPAGAYWLGSPADESMRFPDEDVPRRVMIERPFYLGVFPVTQAEYEAVMRKKPSHFHKKNGGGPDHPVEQVSWDDAVDFCDRLSTRGEEMKADRVYRLPIEAEWECACRAGTTTPFAFGADLSATQANFDGTKPYGAASPGKFRQATTKVGSFPTNAWGFHDMHGNVWEWCENWHTEETHRALRGGSWNNSGHLCRSARRQKYPPEFKGDNVGFRVALDVD